MSLVSPIEGKALPFTPPNVAEVSPAETLEHKFVRIAGMGMYFVTAKAAEGEAYFATLQSVQQGDLATPKIVLKPAILQGSDQKTIDLEKLAFQRQYGVMDDLERHGALVPHPIGYMEIDTGPHAGDYFITEDIDGISLEDLVRRIDIRDPQNRMLLMQVFKSIVDQVWIAHDEGYINRDVKPSNIRVLYTPQDTKQPVKAYITDWGSTYIDKQPTSAYKTNIISEGYTAPEGRGGTMVSYQADIFSLGATLYKMLTNTDLDDEFILSMDPALMARDAAVTDTIVDTSPYYTNLAPFLHLMTALRLSDRYQTIDDVAGEVSAIIINGRV